MSLTQLAQVDAIPCRDLSLFEGVSAAEWSVAGGWGRGSGEVWRGRARVGAGPPRPLQCQGNQMARAACQSTPGGADTTSIIVRR